ncbi:helix-turn-helix domain-containing protein [Streptomyces hydrogenans]|uniref:helix-turn-helix domain-containing protein n=1 Tax=Streptomyces hydrogenans TaxID=1873719 RepID=UPI0037F407E9
MRRRRGQWPTTRLPTGSSHQDALAAQALVVRRFTPYADVEPVDALTKDRADARRFVVNALGPPAEADTALRQALLTYVQCGFNTTRAAANLSAHRNTVERRVSRANELSAVKDTWPNSRGFLGTGIKDPETGLVHLGAREYDQLVGAPPLGRPHPRSGRPPPDRRIRLREQKPGHQERPRWLLPLELWEEVATCSGNTIAAAKNAAVEPTNALTKKKVTTKDGQTNR